MSQDDAALRPTSIAKRRAVLAAAEESFLAARFDTVTMDEIAQRSGVSKQTVYAHFGTKEQLFVELVTSMTRLAGDGVLPEQVTIESADEVVLGLERLMRRQLAVVLEPRVLRLRRLVIAEVPRFPELARAVLANGPRRAIDSLTVLLAELDARGFLAVPDPQLAATQLNWLVVAAPVNDAMFLGDHTAPSAREQRAHVRAAVKTFVAAYGNGGAG